MDDELLRLEVELKRFRPVVPSRELSARINVELASSAVAPPEEPARRRTRIFWLGAGALSAVAAALVMGLVIGSHRWAAPVETASVAAVVPSSAQSAPVATEVFKPVSAENVLYAVSDEGLVTLEDGTAARRERLNYVDTITWKNPRTNASVRWTLPREEVRVVPVKFQ